MKTDLRKTAACALAWTLLILSPGLEPYAAAYQMASSARVAKNAVLPLATLAPLSAPSRSLSSLGPSLGALDARPALMLDSRGEALAQPLKLIYALPSQPGSRAAAPAPKAPLAASLAEGARTLSKAADPKAPIEQGPAALDAVFEGASAKPQAETPVPGALGAGSSGLEPASAPAGQNGPASQPPAPKQSLARSARSGFIAAVLPLLLFAVTQFAAVMLGYQFHPSYRGPGAGITHMTPALAAVLFVGASVMAPIAEEVLFRGALMGGIRKITARIPKVGPFWVPAVASSALFVMVHEMSDPLLFSVRFVHAMILSYVFHKEGYTGSIFAHGFFNGLLMLGMIAPVFLPAAAVAPFTLAILPVSMIFAWFALRKNRAQTQDKASGRLAPYEVKTWQAVMFALALIAGFALLMPNVVWAAGALGWALYAIKRAVRARRSA